MQFGRYWIEGELGRGGAGVVLRARAPTGAIVAIKLLIHADREVTLKRFARERVIHQDLSEAGGFVPLLEHGDSPRGPYIVMPFFAGGTLTERMVGEPWSVRETIKLGRTLARAMGKAHSLGVIHRDLKPDNVLYDDHGRPLIADLGLAKALEGNAAGLTKSGTVAGTVGYMPREQMKDAKSVGPTADVFAIGAILFECLAGEPAFVGDSVIDVLDCVMRNERAQLIELRPDIPAPIRELVERCLDPDPGKRFSDGRALARALVRAESEVKAKARSRAPGGGSALLVGIVCGIALALIGLGLAVEGPTQQLQEGAVATKPEPEPPRPDSKDPPQETVEAQPDQTASNKGNEDADLEEAGGEDRGEPYAALDLPSKTRRLGRLVSGLAGLRPQQETGDLRRRFVGPLKFLATTDTSVIAVDSFGFVRALDFATLKQKFNLRVSETLPTGFTVSHDGSLLALAVSGRIIVCPLSRSIAAEDVWRAKITKTAIVKVLAVGVEPPLLVYALENRLIVINRSTGQVICKIGAHKKPLVALHLKGTQLVAADASGRILVWELGLKKADCRLARKVGTHGYRILCMAVSRQGDRIVSADSRGLWVQWSLGTKAPERKFQGAEFGRAITTAFVEDGTSAWGVMKDAVVEWKPDDPSSELKGTKLGRPTELAAINRTGSHLAFVDAWGHVLGGTDLASKRELTPPPGHYAPIMDAAVAGDRLFTVDELSRVIRWGPGTKLKPAMGRSLPGLVSLAALTTGVVLVATPDGARLLTRDDEPQRLPGLTLTSVARAGHRFLAGTIDGELLWLNASGEVVDRRQVFSGKVLSVLATTPHPVALGEDDRKLFLVGGEGSKTRLEVASASAGALARVDSRRFVVGGQDGALHLCVLSEGASEAHSIVGHEGPVTALATSPDGSTLLSAGDDLTLAAWRVEGRRLKLIERRGLDPIPDRITCMTWLSEGQLFVGTSRGVGLICEWTP